MKLLKVLNVTGRILFAGLLIISHIISYYNGYYRDYYLRCYVTKINSQAI